MNRKHFIKLAALGSVGLVGCWDGKGVKNKINFPINVLNNMKTGHLVREAINLNPVSVIKTQTLIVGGGIAGLSAANSVKNKDFLLVEMDDNLGGTSSAIDINGELFAQGAHYDLSYPKSYGQEGLNLLENLNIVNYNAAKEEYFFKDEKYLINNDQQETCFTKKGFQDAPIDKGINKDDFLQLIKPYVGEMKMPTRLIDDKYRYLDKITFFDFIDKYLIHDPDLISGIDYQMYDDYGANCSNVSALAGIHYYACRDYYGAQKPQLFSPPQGNFYFIDKLAKNVNPYQIKSSCLAFKITKKNNLYSTLVYNTKSKTVQEIISNSIIYAGQKNALKFIYPDYYHLFQNNKYSPWIAINFELNAPFKTPLKWQNDMLGINKNLQGFVNSQTQETKQNILTMYMCYDNDERNSLPPIINNPKGIIENAMGFLDEFFKENSADKIKAAHLKIMGHAMPIPQTNYLFNDRNVKTQKDNFFFAGTDNGRLPLMFEAMDSGILAANYI